MRSRISSTVQSADLSSAIAAPVRQNQAQYLAFAALSGAVLVTARLLPPSPRGVGTHERLGLPPCLFLKLTGWPCPSCGMTTSFAHAARLHFYEALITQPFGLMMFFMTALLIPLSCWLAFSGASWERIAAARLMRRALFALLILWLLGWFYKIVAM
jgi:hypothetical protein